MDDKGERACGITSIILCILNGLSLLSFAWLFLLLRRVLGEMFADFGGQLPVPTRVLLGLPSWLVVLTVVVLLALLIWKEWLAPRWKPLILNVVWLLAGAVATVAILALLALPLVNAMSAVAQLNAAPPPAAESE